VKFPRNELGLARTTKRSSKVEDLYGEVLADLPAGADNHFYLFDGVERQRRRAVMRLMENHSWQVISRALDTKRDGNSSSVLHEPRAELNRASVLI
jgi:hypothetical protein